ncbi:hypothetical protein GGTG_05325 [Gaeumannomyces tritici R3-111a-1]|uniref:Uncharacterized protein n=1 Tax=Gaeumannomyces tritici (strain R3-111a-1) TaxID=644352 RepID=J3NVL0_GAET3|nr:hypothetical protein GGTG_05325 [Gaeumannomyces tritici R3-111a-1]EJT75388.1 hypothetical protein GGTG_05325 [Gaeumannomyces tritici R3-111a-1]
MCLQYLSRPGMQEDLEKLGSAGQVWAEDVQDETRSGAAIDFLTDDKLREPWARAYHAVIRGSAEDTASEKISSLRVCAWLGFDHLLRRFGEGAGKQAWKQAWQQAAMDAAGHGRIKTLRSILDMEPAAGVGLNSEKAIWAAMSSNNEEIILAILDKTPVQTDSSPAWVSDLLLQSSRLGFTAVKSQSCCSTPARTWKACWAPILSQTPLIIASENLSPQVAELLVRRGAKTDATAGNRSWTPLQFAADSGCPLAVKSILNRDSLDRYEPYADHPLALAAVQWPPEVRGQHHTDYPGTQLIHEALKRNSKQMVALLVDNGVDVNVLGKSVEYTPLWQAARRGLTDMAEYLLDNGAKVDKCGERGETPSFETAYKGHAETLELLLLRGADMEAISHSGERLMDKAFRSAETVRVLLRYGAKCNKSNFPFTPLWEAVTENYPNTVRLLLHDDIDGRLDRCELETEVEGSTVLSEALSWRYDDIALDPLDAGANINWVSRSSDTPLHLAVENGNEAVVVAACPRQVRENAVEQDWALHAGTATAADITPHAAEVVGLIKMLLENGVELNPPRPLKDGAG